MNMYTVLVVFVASISSSMSAMTEPRKSIRAREVNYLMRDTTSFLSWPPSDIKNIIWSWLEYDEWVQEKKDWDEKKYSTFRDFVLCDFPAAHNDLIRNQCINKSEKRTIFFVASNNEKKVRRLIRKDRSQVNITHDGYGLIHVASIFGHDNLVSFFIEIDPALACIRDDTGFPSLYYAVRLGWPKVVKILLDNGADKNHIKDKYDSPLAVAARYGHADIVHILLSYRANLESCVKKGETPLYFACQNGFVECTKMLLEAGAQTSVQDEKGRTPLFVAVENDYIEIVKRLLAAGAQVDCKNNENISALKVAVRKGHADMVTLLLAHKAQLTYDNRLIFHEASRKEHENTSILSQLLTKKKKWLLDKRLSLENKDKNGCHPLHIAAQENNVTAIHLLIQHGAKINAQNNAQQTPLHIAVCKSYLETVQVLLGYNPSLEICDSYKDTPLLTCVRSASDALIMQALINAGANIEARGWYFGKPRKIDRNPKYPSCHACFNRTNVNCRVYYYKSDLVPCRNCSPRNVDKNTSAFDQYNSCLPCKSCSPRYVDKNTSAFDLCDSCLPDYRDPIITPLFLACKLQNISQIPILIAAGADISQGYAGNKIEKRIEPIAQEREKIITKMLDKARL